MRLRLPLQALVAAAMLVAIPASAQFAKKDDAVQYRESAMFLMGQHFGRVASMANGRAPFDPAAAAANAELVATMARLPWPAFAEGADGGKAREEIWKEQPKFKELGDKLQAETTRLAEVAKGGDLDALKAQANRVGSTCKACHDDFRKK